MDPLISGSRLWSSRPIAFTPHKLSSIYGLGCNDRFSHLTLHKHYIVFNRHYKKIRRLIILAMKGLYDQKHLDQETTIFINHPFKQYLLLYNFAIFREDLSLIAHPLPIIAQPHSSCIARLCRYFKKFWRNFIILTGQLWKLKQLSFLERLLTKLLELYRKLNSRNPIHIIYLIKKDIIQKIKGTQIFSRILEIPPKRKKNTKHKKKFSTEASTFFQQKEEGEGQKLISNPIIGENDFIKSICAAPWHAYQFSSP